MEKRRGNSHWNTCVQTAPLIQEQCAGKRELLTLLSEAAAYMSFRTSVYHRKHEGSHISRSINNRAFIYTL